MYTFRNLNPTTKTNKNNITADNTIQYSSMEFFGLQSVGIKAKKAVLLVLHCYMIASCFLLAFWETMTLLIIV
uniref:Uncharacterized protein n=1 Tax=Glossina austeni TaxID=7395 RepID=A0A1A9VWF1_GLOAU